MDQGRKAQTATLCSGCGATHKGGKPACKLAWHPNWNNSDLPWEESNTGKWMKQFGHDRLPAKYRLEYDEARKEGHIKPLANIEAPSNKVNKPYLISNAHEHESIDLCAFFDSDLTSEKPCRAERRRTARDKLKAGPKPKALIDGNEATVLLDTGAIDRNFITLNYVINNKLITHELLHPIYVTSIHGNETATKVVIEDITIKSGDEMVNLKDAELIVIQDGPADIIIGMPTLLENRVFTRHTRHFNTGQTQGEIPEKPSGGPHWTVSYKRVRTALNVLGASNKAQRAAIKKSHISELLNIEPEEDPTEDLLPEDIYASYLQDPTRDPSDMKFTVYGTDEEQRILLALLHQYSDVFSDKLGRGAANVTPMTIDVDETGWLGDKRSREPTRPQSAARQGAINRWIQQAIADNVIRPSDATAWSQLHLTPKPNGKWRFNVDYRALNKYTKAARAIIPNIAKLLRHIGNRTPGDLQKWT